jgi:hypothetical protein
MNEGVRRKKTLWSKTGRRQLEALPLAPWATRRRQDLLELVDRLNTTIDELTAAAEQEARKRPEVLRLMTHPVATVASLRLRWHANWPSASTGCGVREVILTDDGYDYLGKRYKSLSPIAGEITGTHWSGPAFFGTRKKELGK